MASSSNNKNNNKNVNAQAPYNYHNNLFLQTNDPVLLMNRIASSPPEEVVLMKGEYSNSYEYWSTNVFKREKYAFGIYRVTDNCGCVHVWNYNRSQDKKFITRLINSSPCNGNEHYMINRRSLLTLIIDISMANDLAELYGVINGLEMAVQFLEKSKHKLQIVQGFNYDGMKKEDWIANEMPKKFTF